MPNRGNRTNDPLLLHPAEPVSIYHVHGLIDDTVSPYAGPSPKPNSTRVDRGAFNSVNTWVRHNNCERVPTVTAYSWGATSIHFAKGDSNTEVLLTLINNLGHAIPPTGIDEINAFLLAQAKP